MWAVLLGTPGPQCQNPSRLSDCRGNLKNLLRNCILRFIYLSTVTAPRPSISAGSRAGLRRRGNPMPITLALDSDRNYSVMVCGTCVSYGALLITFPSLGTVQSEFWRLCSYQNAAVTTDESVGQVAQRGTTSPTPSGLAGTREEPPPRTRE